MSYRKPSSLSIALLLALTLNFVVPLNLAAQEQSRERKVVTAAPARVAPAIAESAPANGGAPRTVEELTARIQEVLNRPELAPAQVAVKAASLDTGVVIFEENAGKLMRPASNMKLYSVAAAFDRLSPDFRFKTSVYAKAPPDNAGTIKGDLTIYGRGDPSIAARFNDGNYLAGINDLANRIVAAGVKRVEGDLIGDESYFSGAPLGMGWEWADLQWYSGAEVSALSVNDNALDLFVKPGTSVGDPCTIRTGPATPLVTFTNKTQTTARGTKRDLSVYRKLGESVFEIGGSLPVDDPGFTSIIAVPNPALMFVYMLRAELAQQGIMVTGRSRVIPAPSRPGTTSQSESLVEVAHLMSPTLSVIAAQTLKPSQNLYAELILRALGRAAGTDPKLSSEEAGIEVVKAFMREAGQDPNGLVLTDGSGLSRRDLVTANSTLQLLVYMNKHRYAKAFRDALPIAGVDGSLRTRMKDTAAAGNVRAKTGTLPTIASLSGYVTSAAGEHLVFSIIVNNYPDSSGSRRSYIDEIAVLLAGFNGKTTQATGTR